MAIHVLQLSPPIFMEPGSYREKPRYDLYREHSLYELPGGSTKVMRYMSHAKFADLLRRKALHFSSLDSLSDKYEGTLPHRYDLKPRRITSETHPWMTDDERQTFVEFTNKHRPRPRKWTMISSWCLSDFESISMWDRYTDREGLAIVSDISSLKSSFVGHDDIYIGKVHYIDYNSALFVPDDGAIDNLMVPFLHKRREYSEEKEIRAVALDLLPGNYADRLSYQPVDLQVLIHKVVTNPEASEWLIHLIESDLERNGIDDAVERSQLSREPNPASLI